MAFPQVVALLITKLPEVWGPAPALLSLFCPAQSRAMLAAPGHRAAFWRLMSARL